MGGVGVGRARRHEYRCSGADGFGTVGMPKSQFTVQDVPRFIIGMVDVKRCGATAAPLIDAKRGARSARKGRASCDHPTTVRQVHPKPGATSRTSRGLEPRFYVQVAGFPR
jgi:hypothetical protein